MRLPFNIKALSDLAPDYMGFIFWEPSKRFVSTPTPYLPVSIKKTGVFVDATLNYISDIREKHKLQALQLHGNESLIFAKNFKLKE